MRELYVSIDQKERLSSLLLTITDFRKPEVRRLYVSQIQERLARPFEVEPYDEARYAVWAIVGACAQDAQALRALFRVVRHFNAEHQVIPELEKLVDEMQRPPLLSGQEQHSLARCAEDLSEDVVRDAFLNVIGQTFGREGEPDWDAPLEVVHRVELACRQAGGVALVVAFAERMAHEAQTVGSLERLHEWIARVGSAKRLDNAVLASMCPDQTSTPVREGYGGRDEIPNSDEYDQSGLIGSQGAPGDDDVIRGSTKVPAPAPEVLAPIRGNLPIRNTDFIGRGTLLRRLREALVSRSVASVVPQALHGLGGVGKTQLAVEYTYRYIDSYELVWWINAEQVSSVRASLAELGKELAIPPSQDMTQAATTVLNQLAVSTRRWLLVYDNADAPDDLADLLPSTGGHVVITSRNEDWRTHLDDAIEVDVLRRDESIELIQRKVGEAITQDEANRLAEKVGDLPLALEQAAAWHTVTGMAVDTYLELFDGHVAELMAENKPPNYPASVWAFLRVAFDRLRSSGVPAAPQLLELFAHLGSDPVSVTLLRKGRGASISDPLREALGDEISLNRAIRELGRHGLAKVVPKGQRLQVHRLVQLVLREGLRDDRNARSLDNVRAIFAAANPGDPDNRENWTVHQEIGPHIESADLIGSPDAGVRQVALDQARYLFRAGDYVASEQLSEKMVARWEKLASMGGLGPEHRQTLDACRHLANAARALGSYERAKDIDDRTLRALQQSPEFGNNHENTVAVGLGLGFDLRLSGEFAASLERDRENLERARVTYEDENQPDALHAKNNVAAALRVLGDFKNALTMDQELVEQWRRMVGDNDARTFFAIANVARDLYGLGRYNDALTTQLNVLPAHIALLGDRHNDVLLALRTMAIAYRKVGQYGNALSQSREIYETYRNRFGPHHEHMLAATMTFANTLRAVGQFNEAFAFASEGADAYKKVLGERHPLTLAAAVNCGIIMRANGDIFDARLLESRVLEDLRSTLGEAHPFTLCAAGNYANSLVLNHELDKSAETNERLLELSTTVRGVEHPSTYGCMLNLSLDLRNVGDLDRAENLFKKATTGLTQVLGENHPETQHALQRRRADFDIEPSPM